MIRLHQSFLSSLLSRKNIAVVFGFAVIFYVTFMWFVCFKTKTYLCSNDTFYYLSIADNLLDKGIFKDGTQIPDGPVITPQNGIVGLFVLLRALSFSRHQVLLITLVLNCLLLLGSIFPLVEISKSVGLSKRHLLFLMICIYLGHIRIFQWLFMAPMNDMIFYSGQLWLFYLFICIDNRLSNEMQPRDRTFIFQISACIFISILLIHFRINSIFLPVAGLLSALLTKRFNMLPLFGTLLVAMALSLSSILLSADAFDFSKNTSKILPFVSDAPNQLYLFSFKLLPESLFKDLQATGNLLYIPFYLSILLAFIQGVKEKNLSLLLIFFISIMTFAMTILHGCLTERYLWVVSAFIYMMLLRIKYFRSVGYLFIVAVLANTLWTLSYSMGIAGNVLNWEDIAAKNILKTDRVLMIAQDHRSCWYFTGIRSIYSGQYQWNDLLNAKCIYLAGNKDYIETHKKNMTELARENLHRVDMIPIPCGPFEKSTFLFYKALLIPPDTSADANLDER